MITSRIHPLFPLAAVLLLVAACGGPQSGGPSDDCAPIGAGEDAERVARAVACYAERPVEESAPQCRAALAYAGELGSDTLATAIRCVLAAGERLDGAAVAEAIDEVAPDLERVQAAAIAVADELRVGVHGTSFAVALTSQAQEVLGEVLTSGGLPGEAAERIAFLAFTYELDPLRAYASPWLERIELDDEIVEAYAESLELDDAPLDRGQQWALVASGRWSALNVISCVQREELGCAEGQVDDTFSSAELLTVHEVSAANSRIPGNVIAALRDENVSEQDAMHLAAWLTSQRAEEDNFVFSVMNEMVNADRPISTRRGIARAANDAMCRWDRVRGYLVRANGIEPNARDDADAVWSTFIARCNADVWGTEERVRALAAGLYLNVPESVRDGIRVALAEEIDPTSCDEVVALGERIVGTSDDLPMATAGWAEAARVAGGECDDALRDRIAAVARDRSAHPEARTIALGWLVNRGDTSACSAVRQIRSWRDGEGNPPRDHVLEALSDAASNCP